MKTYTPSPDVLKRIENNHTYHPPHGDQVQRYQLIREMYADFAKTLVTLAPPSRELSLALTALEDSQMWTNAGIARNEVK